MAEQVTVRREVSNFYAIIGGVVSAGSLISLVQKVFNVGLAPVLAEFVAYYRRITNFFVDWLFFWWPFELSEIYKDLYAVSLIMAMVMVRAMVSVLVADNPMTSSKSAVFLLLMMAFAALISVGLLGIVMGVGLIFAPVIGPGRNSDDEQAWATRSVFMKMLLAMTIATVAFFALNSQM